MQSFTDLTISDVPSFNKWEFTQDSEYIFEWYWEINADGNDWYAVSAQYNPDTDIINVSAYSYNDQREMGDLINAQEYHFETSSVEEALQKVEEYVNKIESEQP